MSTESNMNKGGGPVLTAPPDACDTHMHFFGPPLFSDVGELAKTLVSAAPERMLWASNWPHPSAQENPPDDAMLLDLLLDWVGDEATRKRILVDNPAALYGFK